MRPSVGQSAHDDLYNADGIPNVVESRYGLNPTNYANPLLESDGDGRTNLDEWRSGTARNNSADVLSLNINHLSSYRVLPPL